MSGPDVDHRRRAGDNDSDDLQDLFDNAPCGYLSTRPDGRILRSSHVLGEWLGVGRDALVGRRFQDLLSIAGKIYFETHFAPLLRMQGRFNEVALDLVHADRTKVPVLVNAVERRDEDGRPRSLRLTIFKAEDRRRYETELLAAREALRVLNEMQEGRIEEAVVERLKLEESLRQAQKMEAVGQLTGGLAHDFNNLLTGIMGNLELIRVRSAQGRAGHELDRYVLAALGAAKRAAALTHRLLAFSRRQNLDPKPTNVNRLIADIEELLRRAVEPTVTLEVVGATGLWTALVDANQLESALLNLCINSRDAMPDGGRITVETANKWIDDHASRLHDLPKGQYLSVCVTDTGTGMSKDVVEHAFEPFFTTKPIGVGTGLGLSMVFGFAKQSGGQVRIYSEVGQGTTICIYLPRFFGEASESVEPSPGGDVEANDPAETILIVDDEATVRMLVVEVLNDFGYQAIEASDGPSALKILQSDRRIDLLVTDVGLPGGLNGRQVADAARTIRPGLGVLFITGYADNAVIGNGQLDPGMEILTKPFAIEELALRIKGLVAGQ